MTAPARKLFPARPSVQLLHGPREKTQRAYPRARVHLPTEWNALSGTRHQGEVRDISMGGLFMQLRNPRPTAVRVGSWVCVTLPIVGNNSLTVSGEVRWLGRSPEHRCEGLGIEFNELKATIRDHFMTESVPSR